MPRGEHGALIWRTRALSVVQPLAFQRLADRLALLASITTSACGSCGGAGEPDTVTNARSQARCWATNGASSAIHAA